MLIYICEYCKGRYPVKSIGMKGQINYSSEDRPDIIYSIPAQSEPCEVCNQAGEKAKQEALEKRKKKT